MSETVSMLVVGPNDSAREMLDETLVLAGFQVIIALDAADAVAELNLNAALFMAVITDTELGVGLSGWDVGQIARQNVKEMPVIYLSGGSHDWLARGVPNSLLIVRPFLPAQVVNAVLTLLNSTHRTTVRHIRHPVR